MPQSRSETVRLRALGEWTGWLGGALLGAGGVCVCYAKSFIHFYFTTFFEITSDLQTFVQRSTKNSGLPFTKLSQTLTSYHGCFVTSGKHGVPLPLNIAV